MRYADLHIHSTFSDGTLSPAALVERAALKGLAAIAITDHDTMAGVPEAIIHGNLHGVEVLPGIEISASHNGVALHILGYGLRHDDPELKHQLDSIQQARRVRNSEILARLNSLGVGVSEEELADQQEIGQAGRPHIARMLVGRGKVRTVPEAFYRYLRKGAAAYVARRTFPATEAISMISRAGGVAVLAHPACIDQSLKTVPAIIEELAAAGLKGIELLYPTHTPTTVAFLQEIGRKLGLLFTGGTDFHEPPGNGSPPAPSRRVKVPYEFVQLLHDSINTADSAPSTASSLPNRSPA